jgi:hypothetical protein
MPRRTVIAPDRKQPRAGSIPACVLAALAGLLAGCAGGSGEEKLTRRTVTPAQFVLPPDQRPPEPEPMARQAAHADPGAPGSPALADTGVYRVVPGAPSDSFEPSIPVEAPMLLDAKVGDINGRPVFASEFFDPIAGRLRAESERLGRDEWISAAARIIRGELRSQITDELLRAEALSKLTPDQKAGLRRFLDDVRSNLISENLGSRALAEQRLRAEQGMTEEEYLRQREDRTLVRFTIQEEISNRVNVSWRDIVQRYRRDQARYNPEPTARFWILRVTADDASAVDAVRRQLEAGVPFPEIAAGPMNTWTVDEDGLKIAPFTPPREEARFFAPDELNTPARTMQTGSVAGPIAFGTSLIWLHLEGVEQGAVPLYEAQLPIASQIRSERINAELDRYIDRLLGRASVTDVDRMGLRLLSIATDRYAPPPGPPGPAAPRGRVQ